MTDELTDVTQDDVARILAEHRDGALVPSTALFTTYVRLMEADRRPVATRNALGRALTLAGCTRRRVKRRGEEIHAWRLPGSEEATNAEDRERVHQLHAELGEGIHPVTLIHETYQRLARERGWRGLLPEANLSRLLTQMGYPRMESGRSRYFSPEPKR